MQRSFAAIVLLLLVLPACMMGQNKNELLQNDKIDAKTRTAIAELDKQAYDAICENSFDKLSLLMTDSFKQKVSSDFAQKFMPQIQGVIKGKKFRVFDEFYAKNVLATDTVKIAAGKDDSAYNIKFLARNKETYLSMIVAGDSLDEVMLTLVCIKVNGKWKVDYLAGEDYKLNTRNAADHYHYAQQLKKDNDLVDAVNTMSLASHCYIPGGKVFKYRKENEIRQFGDSVMAATKARYTFPYMITEVSSKPTVFSIHYEIMEHRIALMIYYTSIISVADTSMLRKENNEIQKNIGSIFTGVDKHNNTILYRVYNEMPNGQNNPAYFGYVQKMKLL